MQTQEKRFSKPILRSGVSLLKQEQGYLIDYKSQGLRLDFPENSQALETLLNDLINGGYTFDELKIRNEYLSDEIEYIINSLDNNYLLTESEYYFPDNTLSGEQFSIKLRNMTNSWHNKLGNSALFEEMKNGSVTKNQLIGFVIEYYHIVKAAPHILAPAMSQSCPKEIFEGIKDLFLEEHNHESLLLESLSAIGLDKDKITKTTPLSTTFSVYATLGTYSRQHLLSFISSLFLFEEPYNEFNDEFLKACKNFNMPEGFWKPVIGHSAVNESGEHHLITDRLLRHISAISDEESQTVLVNIMTLLETMKNWDKQICDYYKNELTLRIFQ